MPVGQRLAQAAERLGHLILDGLHRYAQLLGNLLVGEAVALAQQEHPAALLGQVVDGLPYARVSERRVDGLIVDFGYALLAYRLAAVAQIGQAHIAHGAVHERREAVYPPPFARIGPCLDESILHKVLGHIGIIDHAERVHAQRHIQLSEICLEFFARHNHGGLQYSVSRPGAAGACRRTPGVRGV